MMQELARSIVTIAMLTGSSSASMAEPVDVPEAATEEANRILVGHLVGPAAFVFRGDTVPDPVLHSDAQLGAPWKRYQLSGEDCLRYKESNDVDPVPFASWVNFCFPVCSKGQVIAVITVVENRNRDGSKIIPAGGDFVPPGVGMAPYSGIRRWLLDTVQELRGQYPDGKGHTIATVEFDDYTGQRYFALVTNDDGQTLIKQVGPPIVVQWFPELVPLSKAAPRIKSELQWFHYDEP